MKNNRHGFRLGALTCALFAALPLAQAADLQLTDGWKGSLNTTLSLGSSWRMQAPSTDLFSLPDGQRAGVPGGAGGSNTSSGNLNYDKGDRFSTLLRINSELSVSKGDLGGFARVRAWHDFALNDGNVRAGNRASNYALGQPLSDDGFAPLQKFSGIALLDAYVYNTYDIQGKPVQVRLGNQVLNWGESLFIQGINQINPIDLTSLRKPGAEIKDAFLPIPALSVNAGLGGGVSLEGFYQFRSVVSNIDSCGTYFGVVETQLTTKSGRACSEVLTTVDGRTLQTLNIAGLGNYDARLNGLWVPMTDGREADRGDFGLALRAPIEAIDAEMGVYAALIGSRTPFVSGKAGSSLAAPGAVGGMALPIHQQLNASRTPAVGFWEYPDDIRLFGASLSTNLAGWSLGAEVSVAPNQPVQINSGDLITALLSGVGPYGAEVQQYRDQGPGTYIPGYKRFRKNQMQVNGIKILPRMLGASQSTLVLEAAFQHINIDDALRYGRPFIFGYAGDPATAGGSCLTNANLDGSPRLGCTNDGFVTRSSWGYRVRLQFEYPSFAGTSATLFPMINFAHDVKGYSADSQFVEDRRTIGLGARLNFARRHNVEVNYVRYNDRALFDAFRDRDFLSLAVSTSF
jgi:hypothetical protein